MIEEYFVPYDLTVRLLALGFDEFCLGVRNIKDKSLIIGLRVTIMSDKKIYIKAPLYTQAFKFFRDKYNIHAHIRPYTDFDGNFKYQYEIFIIHDGRYNNDLKFAIVDTPKEAELKCLVSLLETVESKSK